MATDFMADMSEKFTKMSKSQKLIASYISDHYDQAVFMTAAKLGETLGISESTVVRFAIMLGYEGYPEFQKALEEWVKNQLSSVQRMGVKYAGSTQSEVLTSVLQSDMDKIRDTRIFVLCCAVVHILANTAQQLLKVSLAVNTLR